MKYIIALITIAIVILIACNSENKNRLFGKPSDLIPDEYVINIEKDTILVVGSSRVDLQACKLEYSIVSPK